jgi:hypothetical protein
MTVSYEIDGETYNFADGTTREEAVKKLEQFKKEKEQQTTSTKDPEYEGVGVELAEGIVSGGSKIAQGIGEFVFGGIDLIADTDYSKKVTKGFEDFREQAGLDPAGFVGKGTEVLTQFAVPGLGAAGVVSKLSKAPGLITKAGQVVAAGAADFLASTDDITSIGDLVGGGITETDQRNELSGRQEAGRRLLNKFKVGAEAGVITATAPAALGLALTGASKVATPIARPIAKGAKALGEKTSNIIKGLDEKRLEQGAESLNPLQRGLTTALSKFRYRGFLSDDIADQRLILPGEVDAQMDQAYRILGNLDTNITKGLKDFAKTLGSKGRGQDTRMLREEVFTSMQQILTSPLAQNLSKADIKKLYKKQIKQLNDKGVRAGLDSAIDDMVDMRTQIDDLSKDIMKSDYFTSLEKISKAANIEQTIGGGIKQEIINNLGSYMRTKYKVFEDATFTASKDSLNKAAVEFQKDPKNLMKELVLMANDTRINPNMAPDDYLASLGIVTDQGRRTFAAAGPTKEQGLKAAENFFNRFKSAANQKRAKSTKAIEDAPIDRLNTNLFKDDNKIATVYQKELLGEINTPKEAFLTTVSDLAEFKAVDNYFTKIRELADSNSGLGKYFKNTAEMTEQEIKNLKDEGYEMLGENVGDLINNLKTITAKDPDKVNEIVGKLSNSVKNSSFGSLNGYMVPKDIHNSLTRKVLGDEDFMTNPMRVMYSNFLRAKGTVQYTKTVLSPPTQIRNFVSASAFAASQGNIGKGANLAESIGFVFNDIAKKGSENVAKELQELKRLGILGTQAEIRELQELIAKGYGDSDVGTKFFKKIRDVVPGGQQLGKGNKFMQDLYQGGDNVWKIYNYKFEVSKLEKALKNADQATVDKFLGGKTINEMAASIVRDTVPNYNKVPEVVKGLRKLPVGNFISFPAEILRTGANTIARGIDELASDIPEIQKIGMRRISGMTGTSIIAPQALSTFAHSVSGVSEEETNAFRRSFGAPWERNARLIPVGKYVDENGETKIQYVNYSYSNPYEYFDKMASSALNKLEESKRLGLSPANIVKDAAFETFSEFIEPFTRESIITSKVRDVFPTGKDQELRYTTDNPIFRAGGELIGGRGGRTLSGSYVYRESDSGVTSFVKGFAHVLEGILPPFIPADVKGGTLIPSPVGRAIVNELGYNETFGINDKDKLGREAQLNEQVFNTLTGFKTIDANLNDLVGYKGHDYKAANAKAMSSFSSIADDYNLTSKQIVDAYRKSMEDKFNVHNDFRLTVLDAKKLGLNETEITSILKKKNVPGFSSTVRGNFDPGRISKKLASVFYDNNNYDAYLEALPEIIDIQREFRSKDFPVDTTQDVDLLRSPIGKAVVGTGKAVGETIGSAIRGEIPLISEAGAAEVTPNVVASPPVNVPPPSPASSAGEINPLLVPNPTTRATFGSR